MESRARGIENRKQIKLDSQKAEEEQETYMQLRTNNSLLSFHQLKKWTVPVMTNRQ